MAGINFSGPVAAAYANDPRTAMIAQMMQNQTSGAPQYGGAWAGLAKGLSGIANAVASREIQSKYADRQKAYQDTLASAYGTAPQTDAKAQMANTMAGGSTPFTNQANPAQTMTPQTPTIPGNMVGQQIPADAGPIAQAAPVDPQQAMLAKLMSNPDTMEQATKLMQARAEQQLGATKPITPFERAQLGGEQIVDAQGNMVPKYQFGRNGSIDASGNYQASPAAQAAMGSMGAPGQGGTPQTGAVSTPKAVNAGQEKTAQNLADVAAPKAGEDPVQNAMDLRATIASAKADNEKAYGGYIAGPATQMMGRLTNDAALSKGQQQSRDAYSNIESAAKNIAAKAAKTAFPQRVTNSDLMIAQQGMAFDSHMSQSERASRLDRMDQAAQRALDVDSLSKAAAMENKELSPADIKAYYLSKGVDPDTFQPTKAQPLPANLQHWMGQSNPQGSQAPTKVTDAAGYAQISKGSQYIAPDGKVRIKQ